MYIKTIVISLSLPLSHTYTHTFFDFFFFFKAAQIRFTQAYNLLFREPFGNGEHS